MEEENILLKQGKKHGLIWTKKEKSFTSLKSERVCVIKKIVDDEYDQDLFQNHNFFPDQHSEFKKPATENCFLERTMNNKSLNQSGRTFSDRLKHEV